MHVEVWRRDISVARVVASPVQSLCNGDVRVRVREFSLTANNVSYAVTVSAPESRASRSHSRKRALTHAQGNSRTLAYFAHFPATDDAYGIVPVWGYGVVVESQLSSVPVGTQLYGYCTYLVHTHTCRLERNPLT